MARSKRQAPAPGPASPPQWPADQVTRRPVSELVPYARNARKHSEAQVVQIAASIKEFGFTVPVLVDEQGGIIAGHGRVLAAKLLGLADVPTMVAAGWSDEKRRAYVVLDNKLALNSEWDTSMLADEIQQIIATSNFTLEGIGFSPDEFLALTAPPEEPKAESTRGGNGLGEAVVQFNIVFDDADQQQSWFAFVRHLKASYPNEATLGARIARFVAEQSLGKD